MSQRVIQQLFDAHVFDSMLLDIDMRDYHVPFDDLTGSATTESSLRQAVGKYERVALTGHSGCGKTSVARYSLDPPPDLIAPIWVPVAYKNDGVTREPKLFAQYLVEVILDSASAVERIPRRDREALLAGATSDVRLPIEARKLGLGVTIKQWIFQGNVARDITRTVGGERLPRSEEAVLAQANNVLETIKAHGLYPVLVMDDTDRFIGRTNVDEIVPAFFGSVLRSVVDNLHAGIVVAAHPYYLERDDYRRYATGLVERHLHIPELKSVEALGRLLGPRIGFASEGCEASDVFDDDALKELFAVYGSVDERSIRSALVVAHAALGRSHVDGAETITVEHVRGGADDAFMR